MRIRMLQSVTRVREIQLLGGRISIPPYALDAGNVYELAADYAQTLMSSGRAVSVEEPLWPAPIPAQIYGASKRTGIFVP